MDSNIARTKWALVQSLCQTHNGSSAMGIPVRCAHARKGGNNVYAVVGGNGTERIPPTALRFAKFPVHPAAIGRLRPPQTRCPPTHIAGRLLFRQQW